MALFENFPYTDLHQLNLDWLIEQLNKMTESQVLSVNGMTGQVTLYENPAVIFPSVPQDSWQILRLADGTTRGIYFANDNRAFILHGNTMSEIYSQNNQPPYPVTSVNGMYGNVELYKEQYVRLPDLDDNQMSNWTLFRILNNVSSGIQFDDDGSAYIISGVNRYMLYSTNNVPPYPVDSVNGQTGTVVLFSDTNGNMVMPDLDDPNYDGWSINRSVNNTNLGLEIKDDGTLKLKVGNAEYDVYTSLNPSEGFVNDTSVENLEIKEDSPDNYWALLRTTTEGAVGIMFDNSDPDNPDAYIAYVDSNDQTQTLKLLTPADIPASGVVSVNAKSGVVTLYATDINWSSGINRTIDDALQDAFNAVAYFQFGSVAGRNYNVNDYIYWHDNQSIYRVTSPISSGDTITENVNVVNNINLGNALRSAKNDITTLQNTKAYWWTAGSHTLSTNFLCTGHISNGGSDIYIYYPVEINPNCGISSFTLTSATIRGINGYVLNNVTNFTGYTITASVHSSGLTIKIVLPTAQSAINNTPLTAQVGGTIILT